MTKTVAVVIAIAMLGPGTAPSENISLRDAVVEQLGPLQAKLRLTFPTIFGGLWVNDHGETTIAVVGDPADVASVVDAAHIVGPVGYRSVAFSESDIRSAHLELRRVVDYSDFSVKGVKLAAIAEDVVNNRLLVSAVGDDMSPLAAVAKDLGPMVSIESVPGPSIPVTCTRQNCPSPLKAGLQLYHAGSSACISAFVFRNKTTPFSYYLSTAGHCASVGDTRQHPSGTGIGSITFKSSGPSAGVDAALIHISDANASNLMFNSGGSTRSITSSETIASAVIGEGVCSSKPSGQTCGSLTAKGVDTCCAMDEFEASFAVAGGDSGSPVYYGFKAEGIVSAQNCPDMSHSCYTAEQSVEIWRNFVTLTAMP